MLKFNQTWKDFLLIKMVCKHFFLIISKNDSREIKNDIIPHK